MSDSTNRLESVLASIRTLLLETASDALKQNAGVELSFQLTIAETTLPRKIDIPLDVDALRDIAQAGERAVYVASKHIQHRQRAAVDDLLKLEDFPKKLFVIERLAGRWRGTETEEWQTDVTVLFGIHTLTATVTVFFDEYAIQRAELRVKGNDFQTMGIAHNELIGRYPK